MSEKIASLYAEIGGTTAPLEQALGETTDSLNIFETQLGQAGDATDEFGQAAADTAADMDELADSADDVESSGGGVKEQFNALRQGLGAFNFVMGAAKVAFDEVTASADRLGRTELGDSLDKLDVTINKVKDSLITMEIGGRDTIAWVTDAIDGFDNYIKTYSALGIWIGQTTGLISDQEAAARAAALVHEDVVLTLEQLEQAEIDAAASLDAHERAAAAATQTTEDLTAATEEAAAASDVASSVYYFAEQQIQNLNITEGERLVLERAIKIASGELTTEEIARENAIINLTQALNEGRISNQEYLDGLNQIATTGELASGTLGLTAATIQTTGGAAAEAADQVDAYSDSVRAIPAATTTTITTQWINTGQVPTGGGAANSGANVGMAEGGIATGPSSGYPMTLHGTEAVIPLSNGSVPVEIKGGSGGGSESMMWELIGLLRNLPVQISRAIRDALLAMGK